MKKLAVSLVALLAVVVMCFSLAACGASGTYKLYSYEVGGKEYKVGDTINTPVTNKEIELEEGSFELVLKGDGTCVFKNPDSKDGVEGKWEEGEKDEEGKTKISFTGVSGLTNVTRDGNKIVFDFFFAKVTLKK